MICCDTRHHFRDAATMWKPTIGEEPMIRNGLLLNLTLALTLCALATTARAGDDSLITKASQYSVRETVARFEAAVKAREAAGFTVFTEIDHAAAAKRFGLDMRPRTVIVF